MIVILPRSLDVVFRRLPIANVVIMGLIVAGFFAYRGEVRSLAVAALFGSNPPYEWSLGDIFWHMWAHAGWFHLIGNLIFLWVFGNAVCARVGNVIYVPVYVGLGVLAILPNVLCGGGPAVGASGAISGVIGMFLVLNPTAPLTSSFILFVGWWNFTFRSFWAIVPWFLLQVLGAVLGGGMVLYSAHIAGFVAGCGLAILLLKKDWLQPEPSEKSLLQILRPGKKTEREFTPFPSQSTRRVTTLAPPDNYFVSFVCKCGAELRAPRKRAGEEYTCPKCSAQTKIPAE